MSWPSRRWVPPPARPLTRPLGGGRDLRPPQRHGGPVPKAPGVDRQGQGRPGERRRSGGGGPVSAKERSSRPARPGHLVSATLLTIPGGLLGLSGLLHLGVPVPAPPVQTLLYGLAVVGAAFLLGWAAEAAQIDVSASLAIGALALVAVLPEYAVGFVFAWKGGNDVERYGESCQPPGDTGADNCSLVLANMTGANRLLIGVGWAMVVLVAWWRWRSRGERRDGIVLGRSKSVELG